VLIPDDGPMSVPPANEPPQAQPVVWIVRHGETEWSKNGKHTSFTDLPLTENGERTGAQLAERLKDEQFDRVLSSPMTRARRTAELAGFGDRVVVDDRLVEWQYGEYEGITTAETRQTIPDFTVWTHWIYGGEQLYEVAERADAVIADLRTTDERTLIFAHGHFLRVFTASWLGLRPITGANFELHTATISVLGWERDTPTLQRWNA
jgi:broad specificity phosphatase PhoE